MITTRLLLVACALALAAVPAPAAAQTQCEAPGSIPPWRECDTTPPHAEFEYEGTWWNEPARFTSTSRANPDRTLEKHEWDFNGDGQFDAEGREVTWTFRESGYYDVTLRVTDSAGATDATKSGVSVSRRPPQSITLTVDKADVGWPNQVTIGGQVHPVGSRVEQVYLRWKPLKEMPGYDEGGTIALRPDANGAFSTTVRPVGNSRFVAELGYPDIESEPLDVYVNWLFRAGWNRIRGGLVEAGFVVRPAAAGAGIIGRLAYLYWHRRGSAWLRRVGIVRVRFTRTNHAVAYKRFRVRRPRKRDGVVWCIRGAGSDNWGRPWGQLNSRCGARRLPL